MSRRQGVPVRGRASTATAPRLPEPPPPIYGGPRSSPEPPEVPVPMLGEQSIPKVPPQHLLPAVTEDPLRLPVPEDHPPSSATTRHPPPADGLSTSTACRRGGTADGTRGSQAQHRIALPGEGAQDPGPRRVLLQLQPEVLRATSGGSLRPTWYPHTWRISARASGEPRGSSSESPGCGTRWESGRSSFPDGARAASPAGVQDQGGGPSRTSGNAMARGKRQEKRQ